MFKKDRWKTTLAGLGAIITGVATIAAKGDLTAGVSGILSGIGLVFAKDAINQ